MKKFISVLLCFVLCINLMPVITSAEWSMYDNDFRVEFSDLPEGATQEAVIRYKINDGEWQDYAHNAGDKNFKNGADTVDSISFEVTSPKTESNDPIEPFKVIRTEEGSEKVELSIGSGITDEGSGVYSFSITPTQVEGMPDYKGFKLEIFWTEDEYNNQSGGGDPPPVYTITVSVEGNGHFIYDEHSETNNVIEVPAGSDHHFDIEAEEGYEIGDVLINGTSIGAECSYTFTNVTTDQSIHATFIPKTFTITTIVKDDEGIEGVGGEIYCPDPLTGIPYDATRTFSITPGDGYRLKEIIDNGENRGADNSYQLDNIRENHTIEVIFEPIGDGTMHTITVQQPVNGSVATADGPVEGQVTVEDGYDVTFTVTPNPGYRISAVMITENGFTDDWSWNLAYIGNGDFEFPLFEVRGDMDIEFVFEAEDLESLLENNFVVLEEETESDSDLKESLIRQFGGYGYAISEGNITITDVDKEDIDNDDYGTFTFTVTPEGEGSPVAGAGYIVKSPTDIIFKLDDGNESVIKVVRPSEDPDIDELAVPAMSSGTMEVFGYGNLVAAPMTDLERDENGRIKLPFNCAQFHIFNFMPPGDGNVNLYGFYVIQDDALCVRVSAKSGENEQKTVLWDLNRYTNLTEGNDTSYVFFGNDEFILSIPPSGIGAATSLEVEEEDFGGYIIEANGDGTYSVNFLSDFYDDITVDLKINDIDRQLRIRRVGVEISAYGWEEGSPEYNTVAHGTQSSTIIDFSQDHKYKVYATYCIPDDGDYPPYGLYVVYTWADGSKTTDIITEPCSTPAPMAYDIFSDGVFHYANHADSCDYLLYSGESKAQAPVKINVTVLKGDPAASGSFSGVFFGSGAGVEWVKEEDE